MEKFRYKVYLAQRDGEDVSVTSTAVRTVLTPEQNYAIDIEVNDLMRALHLPVDEDAPDNYMDWVGLPLYLVSRSEFKDATVTEVLQMYCDIVGMICDSTMNAYQIDMAKKESDA